MNPSSENGQSMTEYALILTLIAIAAAAAFAVFGGTVTGLYQSAVDVFSGIL